MLHVLFWTDGKSSNEAVAGRDVLVTDKDVVAGGSCWETVTGLIGHGGGQDQLTPVLVFRADGWDTYPASTADGCPTKSGCVDLGTSVSERCV